MQFRAHKIKCDGFDYLGAILGHKIKCDGSGDLTVV